MESYEKVDWAWGFFLNHVSFRCACVHAKSLQSCLILCDPMDCILPGSRVHGIPSKNAGMGCHALLQRNLPDLGIKPASLTSPALAGRLFTTSAAWETHSFNYVKVKPVCIKCVQTLPGELFVTSYNKIYFLIKRVVLATWK